MKSPYFVTDVIVNLIASISEKPGAAISCFLILPIEHLIKQQQEQYYRKLSESDKKGNSTPFIAFMLGIILDALEELLQAQNKTLHIEDRMQLFKEKIGSQQFSRKDLFTPL